MEMKVPGEGTWEKTAQKKVFSDFSALKSLTHPRRCGLIVARAENQSPHQTQK
jgi:hypothetical protein